MTLGTFRICASIVLLLLSASTYLPAASPSGKVLVYTRNGKGYVHDNIQTAAQAIRRMGEESGLEVEISDDPAVFRDERLRTYKVLIFANSNNEAFTDESQRQAFQRYIRAGGGFVGIHSASGSERNWPYYASVVGGKFIGHPKLQTFKVRVVDPNFPATKGLPAEFEWTDECYFNEKLNPDIHPLFVTDRTKLTGLGDLKFSPDSFPNPLPLGWWHEFDGGREFYISLGHRPEEYGDPLLYGIIKHGILWAAKME